MNGNSYLLMWLEGPLQSWGFDSRFYRKNSLEFPTKSGLLGMLCCAMGAGGKQRDWLEKMTSLRNTVLAYSKKTTSPVLRDFHMIGSGYDENDSFENLMIPRKSDDKKPENGSKLTYRFYLQNAFFAAVLEIPKDQSERLSNALVNPVWDLFLGRKTCVPTDFIYRGIFDSEDAALRKASEIAEEKSLIEKFKVLDGSYSDEGEVLILNDVPVEFGEHKKYSQRYVTLVHS